MGTRTSGSEGGGKQTTARKRGTAARLRPYHSIIQRKLLEPNHFDNLAQVARTLNAFEHHWNQIAEPFDWRFHAELAVMPIWRRERAWRAGIGLVRSA